MNLQILSLVCAKLADILCNFFLTFCPDCQLIACFITGHVFAYGLSRSAAITNMTLALKEIQIRGEIHSNVDYTVDLLNVRNIKHLF
jgi:hypothetical protein